MLPKNISLYICRYRMHNIHMQACCYTYLGRQSYALSIFFLHKTYLYLCIFVSHMMLAPACHATGHFVYMYKQISTVGRCAVRLQLQLTTLIYCTFCTMHIHSLNPGCASCTLVLFGQHLVSPLQKRCTIYIH